MGSGRDSRSGRVWALDGVRGMAVVAVVLFHAFPEAVPGGFFGVEAFFVLSGFVTVAVTAAAPPAPATTAVRPPRPAAARPAAAPPPAPARSRTATRPPNRSTPAAPLPPGPPPGSVSVLALGDSVMLSAAGPLKARLGPSGSIDAKVSRQFREGIAIVASLRQQGGLAPVVVVHLGTNGPPTPGDVDAVMAAAGTSRVLLLTVRVNRDWSAEANAVLAGAPTRHQGAILVDWNRHSLGHDDWFHSDGTHLTTVGAQAYAALIGSMLPAPPPPPPPTAPPATSPHRSTTTTVPR